MREYIPCPRRRVTVCCTGRHSSGRRPLLTSGRPYSDCVTVLLATNHRYSYPSGPRLNNISPALSCSIAFSVPLVYDTPTPGGFQPLFIQRSDFLYCLFEREADSPSLIASGPALHLLVPHTRTVP